jgi:hypothetical protein
VRARIGIGRFVELNPWAEKYVWTTDTKTEEDTEERFIQTGEIRESYEADLYAPLHTMYKFGKTKKRWY